MGLSVVNHMAYSEQKCTQMIDLVGPAGGSGDIRFGISRMDFSNIAGTVKGVDETTRFQQLYRLYEQYAITGLVIEYMPGNIVGRGGITAPDGVVGRLWAYDDINTYDTTSLS